jgi:hypothetical protein
MLGPCSPWQSRRQPMLSKAFVGRDTAVAKLTAVLQGRLSASGKLAILSIEGPGGIGKTCLFDHVMQTSDFTSRKYLCLRVDCGGSLLSAGLLPVMSRLVDSARSAPTLVKPAGYYFPAAKRTLTATEAVKARALHEFAGKAPGDAVTKSLFARLLDAALEKWHATQRYHPPEQEVPGRPAAASLAAREPRRDRPDDARDQPEITLAGRHPAGRLLRRPGECGEGQRVQGLVRCPPL